MSDFKQRSRSVDYTKQSLRLLDELENTTNAEVLLRPHVKNAEKADDTTHLFKRVRRHTEVFNDRKTESKQVKENPNTVHTETSARLSLGFRQNSPMNQKPRVIVQKDLRNNVAADDDFINSNQENKTEGLGTFIKGSIITSKAKSDLRMERKLQLYVKKSNNEEHQKDIVTHIIPELRKTNNIRSLSEWLQFDNHKIKEKLLCEIENLLLKVSPENAGINDIVHIMSNVLSYSFQRTVHADEELFLPLRVLTLCFAILQFLNSGTSNSAAHVQVQNISIRVHGELSTVRRNPHSIVYSQVTTLLTIIEYFKDNSFQIGLTEKALSQLNHENVVKEFSALEYSCKLVYIVVLVNSMLQKCTEGVPELIMAVLKPTFDSMARKQKSRPLLHPLLHIVTKGISLRLVHGPDREKNWNTVKQCLLLSLRIYLTSSRLDLLWRGKMLECLQPLIFIADKDVVKDVIYVFQKCGHKHKYIRDIVVKHVRDLLTSVNLKLYSFQTKAELSKNPVWCSFPGKIWKGLDVNLNLLLPTVKCLVGGSMEDYRNLADKRETKKHGNNLEIMRLLQFDKSHPNLAKLIGYQYRPLPLYYLTECHKNLHTYLLEQRQYHKWLSRDKLAQFTLDTIAAVQYLHSKNIVHRNLTIDSFSINDREIILLHDFCLAKMLETTEEEKSTKNSYANVVNDEDIPVLYSAPESLLEDKYDFRTDTWMVGLLIYGLYTHCGVPYTVNGLTTDKILEYVVFQELKPTRWPCISKNVFKAIMGSVESNSDSRIELDQIKTAVEDHLSELHAEKFNSLSSLFEVDKKYPPPVCALPERGLPELFLRLKQDLNPRRSYYDLRRCLIRSDKCCITLDEVTAEDTPVRTGGEHARYLQVEEPVTLVFVEDELPQLKEQICTKVLKMVSQPTKIKRQDKVLSEYEYVLHYKCHLGENIIDVALRNYFGAPGIDSTDILYLGLTYNLVKFVHRMHSHHWLLRDICGYSIFVDTNTLSVFMPRIGRFRRLISQVTLDDCILGDSFNDRLRWLPIEVIQNGLFSKESDIYMLGMTIWEMYTALDLCDDNPSVNPLEGKPFASIPKRELLTELYSGGVPNLPASCPLWLYDLLKRCWDRNRTLRPSAEFLLAEIKERIKIHPRNEAITHMVDVKLKLNPSDVLNRSGQSFGSYPTAQSESKANITETCRFSNHIKERQEERKLPAVPDQDDDYPELRQRPGRKNGRYIPSGFYDNEPESTILNISRSETSLSLQNINEDNEPADVKGHNSNREIENVIQRNINLTVDRKLSRIDSGFGDDAASMQSKPNDCTVFQTKPEDRTNVQTKASDKPKVSMIPPIPIAKGKSIKIPKIPSRQKSNTQNEENKPIIQASEQEVLIKPEILFNSKDLYDTPPIKTKVVSLLSEKDNIKLKDDENQTRSRDDMDTDEFLPVLVRFRSCNLLTEHHKLSTASRASYV